MTDTSRAPGLDEFADALQSTFPCCDDAPLALALLRLLAQGAPVSPRTLADISGRHISDVAAQLDRWPNVQRDGYGKVTGFSGLTLTPTAHEFEVERKQLYTWCAWDTLFVPALLGASARVRSTCPVTGISITLDVSPDVVTVAKREELQVSFPPLATTDTANIVASFCCHVHFLADAEAGRRWRAAQPDASVLDLPAAFELGRLAVAPLMAAQADLH